MPLAQRTMVQHTTHHPLFHKDLPAQIPQVDIPHILLHLPMQHDSERPPYSIIRSIFHRSSPTTNLEAIFRTFRNPHSTDGLVLNLALLHSIFLLFCNHCHLRFPFLGLPHTHFHLDLCFPLHTTLRCRRGISDQTER